MLVFVCHSPPLFLSQCFSVNLKTVFWVLFILEPPILDLKCNYTRFFFFYIKHKEENIKGFGLLNKDGSPCVFLFFVFKLYLVLSFFLLTFLPGSCSVD